MKSRVVCHAFLALFLAACSSDNLSGPLSTPLGDPSSPSLDGVQAIDNAASDNGAGADALVLGNVSFSSNVGDLLVAQVTVLSLLGTQVICAPGGQGWTSAGRTNNGTTIVQEIFYKTSTGPAEPDDYTFTFENASCAGSPTGALVAAGGLAAWSGVNVSSPLDGAPVGLTGTSATAIAPGITTAVNGSRVLRFFGNKSAFEWSTAAGGFSRQYWQLQDNVSPDDPLLDISIGMYDSPPAAAGGNPIFSRTTISATSWVAQTVALKSAIAEKLAIVGGPLTGESGSCMGPFAVQAQNNAGTLANVAALTPIILTTVASGAFHNSAACDFADATVSIASGLSTSEQFYYLVPAASDGTHQLTASLDGTGLAPGSVSLTIGAANVGTTTEVLAAPTPSVFGQSVTFTATVTPTSGPAVTGTVNFYEFTGGQTCAALGGASIIGTDGTTPFQFSTSSLSVGTHTISACYIADPEWTNSNDDVVHVVNKANVTVGVIDSPTSSVFGQSVTFTATVAAAPPGAGTPTGTVTFYEFSAGQSCGLLLGSPLLGSDGAAPYQLTTSSLSVATHTITACYGGDGNFNPNSASDTHTVSVSAIGTTTAVLASPTPSVFGQSVTFTATVTPASGPAVTGTVNFYEFTAGQSCGSLGGASTIGTDGSAPFQFSTSSLSVATHTISACYIANPGWTDSNDDVVHIVSKAEVLVTVTDSPTSSTFGQSVTFTATVAAAPPGAGTPTGTVTFYEFSAGQSCGLLLGSPLLGSDGAAPYQLTTSSLSVAAHTITACYGGDGNFNPNSASDTHTVSVSAIGTTTAVLASPTPSVFGQSVTFTATVTPASGPAVTGTVNFYEFTAGQSCGSLGGASTIGTDASAPFQFSTSSLSVATHTISACYIANPGWTNSNDDVVHVVSSADVMVGVTDSPTSSVFGQSVTFTATVAAASPSAGTPTGTVTFYEFVAGQSCGLPLGSPPLGSDGNAPFQLVTSSLSVAAHTITACYGGDGNFNPNSGSDAHPVGKAPTNVVVTSNTPTTFGSAANFLATVNPVLPGAGTPTGTVTFYEFGAGQSCAAPPPTSLGTDATAPYQFSTSSLAAGVRIITACYPGDGNFLADDGSSSHTVTGGATATTTTVVASTTTTAQYSDEIDLNATVTPAEGVTGGGISALTGNVRFYFQAAAVSCPAIDPGALGSGVVGSDDIVDADNGIADDTDYQVLSAAGAYVLTACFYSTNSNFTNGRDTEAVTVTTEDATVTRGRQFGNSFPITPHRTYAASITLQFVVKETNPEPDANAGAFPGDIDQAGLSVVLNAVGSAANNEVGTCTPSAPVGAPPAYADTKTYSCVFTTVNIDAYEIVATVNGTYYDGGYVNAMSVYDPDCGIVTGGGNFTYPGSTDPVTFGVVFNNQGNKATTGSIVVIRHMANGDVCRTTSKRLSAIALDGKTASFSGTGNYYCMRPNGTVYGAVANQAITGWVEEDGQGSNASGPDRIWIRVTAPNSALLMTPTESVNILPLTGGSPQVPPAGGSGDR